jgi:hypothetical protein
MSRDPYDGSDVFGDQRYLDGSGRAQWVGITIGIVHTSREFRPDVRRGLKFLFETKEFLFTNFCELCLSYCIKEDKGLCLSL